MNVGVGSRSRMYLTAITKTFARDNELVAICDTNQGRLEIAAQLRRANGCQAERNIWPPTSTRCSRRPSRTASSSPAPTASTTNTSCAPWTPAATCITEKPLTTTPEKAQRIVDACKRNNRHVRVLFNYRYSPPRTQVKDLLMSGAIGDMHVGGFPLAAEHRRTARTISAAGTATRQSPAA